MVEKASIDLVKNLIVDTNKNENKNEECKVKCDHELDMNDENEHLNVIDAISVQTELEQLFNDFNIYNHHMRVFKKLLNLKELKNQYNFFTFNHQQNSAQPNTQPSKKINNIIYFTDIMSTPNDYLVNNELQSTSERLNELNSTLFKGGELSAMQVHSQLKKIKDQFLESQMLVTCLIHNIHSLKKNHCGTALDLVSCGELLANLEKNHNALKRCKSIFKYQCSKKREQLEKLKNQLKRAREDWNLLIVREPTKHQLSNEELLLLSKLQTKKKRKYELIENQSTNTNRSENEPNDRLNIESDVQKNTDLTSINNGAHSYDLNVENDLNQSIVITDINNEDKIQKTSNSSNCDSAVQSESESVNSIQELTAAIYRRKSKLDRLENECFTFLTRLANRNRALNKNMNGSYNKLDSNLIIDDVDDLNNSNNANFNDYGNEYDENLLDEEYDDMVLDEITNHPFVNVNSDIETLLSRFSNVHSPIDTEDAVINQDLEEDRLILENFNADEETVEREITNYTTDNNLQITNVQTNNVNFENYPYTSDFLIEERGAIQINTGNHLNNAFYEIVNTNEPLVYQSSSNAASTNSLIIDNEVGITIFEQATRARLNLSRQSLNSLGDQENNALNSSLMSRISNEETTLAKTGEPISLCKLRRKAVKILASRIRTEKEYYEGKENELKQKLNELLSKKSELENQLAQSNRSHRQLFLISTAFVFCSLINYFIQI